MKKIQTMIPMILGLVFLVIVILVCSFEKFRQNEVLDGQMAEIHMLEQTVMSLSNEISKQKVDILIDTTGLDVTRISRDKDSVEKLLNLVCTWNSYVEYMHARETVMRRYNLSEDDGFMSTFMPGISEQVSPNGDRYNRIDYLGLNMTYETVHSMVTRILAPNYYYFAIVTVSSSWKNGGESISKIAMTYGVDADGNLFDIYAIPIA